MVPYDPPPRGGARRCWDANLFGIFDTWIKWHFLYQQIKTSTTDTKLIKHNRILTFWRLEKNPHEFSVISVQKLLETDNSASSYDIFFGFNMINHG